MSFYIIQVSAFIYCKVSTFACAKFLKHVLTDILYQMQIQAAIPL